MLKTAIIRQIGDGKYRLYSSERDSSGKRKNLGTFDSRDAAEKHEREVQYFKHKDEDNADDDPETKALSKLSDIAKYLESAGMVEKAKCIYDAMCAIDNSLEDNVLDTDIRTDEQYNVGGAVGYSGEGVAGGSPSLLSIDEAEKVASLANKLDQKGLYAEAAELDELLKWLGMTQKEYEKAMEEAPEDEITDEELEEMAKYYEEDENLDALVRSNGRVGTGVTDNQNAGMFQGFSDAYFYSGYGNLEGAYGPQDR